MFTNWTYAWSMTRIYVYYITAVFNHSIYQVTLRKLYLPRKKQGIEKKCIRYILNYDHYNYSTLPRGKKDISYPLPNRNDNYTAKQLVSSENNNKPAYDHDNVKDEVCSITR